MSAQKKLARHLIALLLAVLAAAMILYGLYQIALSASLSDRNMRKLASETDYEALLDKPFLVRIVNTAIYKWTNAFSSSSIYLTEETLPLIFDEEDIRPFLSKMFCGAAYSLKTGNTFDISREDLAGLPEALRAYVSGKIGMEITAEQAARELESAVKTDGLSMTFPKTVRLTLGIISLSTALIILLVMLYLYNENLFIGGLCFASAFVVPASVLMALSPVYRASMFSIPGFPVGKWVFMLGRSMRSVGLLGLLPALIGLALMLAYTIDKKRIKKLTAQRKRGDDLL